MQEINDKLIEDFLNGNKKDIPDNGFSQRVMKQLPYRTPLVARLWTGGCFIVTALLFIVLDGFELIYKAIQDAFETLILQGVSSHIDTHSLAIAGIVLLYLAYRKIASLA